MATKGSWISGHLLQIILLNFEKTGDLKVEYHANENPLKKSEKIAYVGQRLMYPLIKQIIPYQSSFFFKCHYVFRFLHLK